MLGKKTKISDRYGNPDQGYSITKRIHPGVALATMNGLPPGIPKVVFSVLPPVGWIDVNLLFFVAKWTEIRIYDPKQVLNFDRNEKVKADIALCGNVDSDPLS